MTSAIQTDVWKQASQTDILQCLALLAVLPARPSDNPEADKGAMYVALEGVTRYGLHEATRVILKGGLGHTFFPTPVELRQRCDSAMSWHERERDRIRRRQLQTDENRRFDEVNAKRSAEAIARQQQAYATFCAGYAAKKAAERIHLDPELVAKVPNAPSTFKRPA